MSERDNQRLVEEQFAAFNAHDLDRYLKTHAESYVWETDGFPTPIRGHEAVRQALAMYFRAFPDLHLEAEQTITDGDHVVVRWRASGTHKGEFSGVAPTNKRVNVRGCTVSEVESGRVTRSHTLFGSAYASSAARRFRGKRRRGQLIISL